ncbi:MAG: hypothetical protein ACRC0K_00485 [Fusobacteriaceae bacterium]
MNKKKEFEIKKSCYCNIFLVNARIDKNTYGVGVAKSLEQAKKMLADYKKNKVKTTK